MTTMRHTATLPEINSVEQARSVIANQFQQIQQLFWRVGQLEKALYGASSERQTGDNFSREQTLLSLFGEAQPASTDNVVIPDDEQKREPRSRPPVIAKELETVTERIEPVEKVCPHCGQEKCQIGCETSERFEFIPAKVVRHEIVRPKLACACGEGGVSIAPLPPQVIEQGKAGASLVAQVILNKFDNHMPLYRQQQEFARLGLNFPRQTLADWVEKGAHWLQAIVTEMKRELLAGDYLQVDETPVKVMDADHPGKCATGWLWVGGLPGSYVIFEFHKGRGKAEGAAFMNGFKGTLQRDGYGVYGSLARDNPGLISAGCWSHARRKFVDALDQATPAAREIVEELRQLYLIERHAREAKLDATQRKALRQEKSAPILAALKAKLERQLDQSLPQSPLGKAVRYTLAEWPALTRYLADGRVEIDNNLTENAIRPSAVGKKNWLFIGHPEAGWRSAVIYSVIVSCRRVGIDPWEYLRDVLRRLPGMKQSELRSILPAHWKPASAPSPIT
jgi:transposase